MKSTLAVYLLLFTAIAGAEHHHEGSISEPTELSMLAAETAIDVAGTPVPIASEKSTASITVVKVLAGVGNETHGVRFSLRSANREDSIYLDTDQIAQIRDEFAELNRWYQRQTTCGAQSRCVHGTARCRPSQTISQALCPGFYYQANGERGVIVGTPRHSFLFPSVGPSEFVKAINAAIGD